MRNFFEKYIPILWSICWVVAITALSVGSAIWFVKWVLGLVGVI